MGTAGLLAGCSVDLPVHAHSNAFKKTDLNHRFINHCCVLTQRLIYFASSGPSSRTS